MIGREYQTTLLSDLRTNTSDATSGDMALLLHMEQQAKLRDHLQNELRRASATKLLAEYSFRVTSGLTSSDVDPYVNYYADPFNRIANANPDMSVIPNVSKVPPLAVETLCGTVTRSTPTHFEINNVYITELLDRMDGGTFSQDDKAELLQRMTDPSGTEQIHYPVVAGIFAHDRIKNAKQGIVIGMSRAVSLLTAIQSASLLEISFEWRPYRIEELASHGLDNPPIPPADHDDITLVDAAMHILDNR